MGVRYPPVMPAKAGIQAFLLDSRQSLSPQAFGGEHAGMTSEDIGHLHNVALHSETISRLPRSPRGIEGETGERAGSCFDTSQVRTMTLPIGFAIGTKGGVRRIDDIDVSAGIHVAPDDILFDDQGIAFESVSHRLRHEENISGAVRTRFN